MGVALAKLVSVRVTGVCRSGERDFVVKLGPTMPST